MDGPRPVYWFPAKRHGWGWGPPVAWQGRTFLALWLLVVVPGAPLLAERGPGVVAAFLAVVIAVLLAVCWTKGEPPRWRN